MNAARADDALDLQEIAERIEFANVRVFELSGRRKDGGFDGLELPGDDWEDPPANPEIQFFVQQDDRHLSVRGRLEVENRMVSCRVDLAVTYTKDGEFEVDDNEQMPDFISRVALGNIYPFMRQHIHDTSSRLGAPITLGLLQLKSGTVTANSPDDEG